jgi:hypothetical protein
MKHNKPIVIIILMSVLLFLVILNLILNKKADNKEHFQSTQQVNSDNNSEDLFPNTYDFTEYSRNSDKLQDMFKTLKNAEKTCSDLEYEQVQREELDNMRENDRIHKELLEQEKKIHELKEIVKYLTIEKKRRDKINKNCMSSKQRKLNENYNLVQSLHNSGFLKDNKIDMDLNISDSEKLKNFLSSIKKDKSNGDSNNDSTPNASDRKKCKAQRSDEVNLDEFDKMNKCYGCDADKLKRSQNYINKDF